MHEIDLFFSSLKQQEIDLLKIIWDLHNSIYTLTKKNTYIFVNMTLKEKNIAWNVSFKSIKRVFFSLYFDRALKIPLKKHE